VRVRDTPRSRAWKQSIEWTLARTIDRAKAIMLGLPFDLRFDMTGQRVRLVHDSPRKVNEYLFEDKPASRYTGLAAAAECDVLVLGPTHPPWVRECGGVLFVNCGSVGKPKDGDLRGAFDILESVDGRVIASIERVPYDAEAVAREVEAVGLPSELATKLVAAS
jgi:diadenosine tetraphosphatase ApaH/serine/threonine PP2A family protein phosphatase